MNCNPFEKYTLYSDNRLLAAVAENKKRYCANNTKGKNMHMIKVDGCLITDADKEKCDYLLLACTDIPKKEKCDYFTELKGANFLHGISQLISAVKFSGAKLKDFSINARLVVSKIYAPDLRNSKLIRLERMLKQKGGNFKKCEKNLVELI